MEAKVISKTFKLDLSKSHYTPWSYITLVYEPNSEDPVRKLGEIYMRGPNNERIKLAWEDPRTNPLVTEQTSPFSVITAYAGSTNETFIFKENGSYDPQTGRALQEQLGSDDLKTQIAARRVLVHNGKRSFKFIIDTLTSLPKGKSEGDLLLHNLANATTDIEAQGFPVPADINIEFATLFYDERDYESSARYFNKAGGWRFDKPELYFRCGYAYSHTREFEKSLDCYNRYLAKTNGASSRSLTYTAIGMTYRRMGRPNDAEANYRKAMKIYPDLPFAYNDLAYLYAERGDRLAEALTLVDHALQLSPNDPDFKDTKGWILYKQGKTQEGLALVKEALDAAPSNPEIKVHFSELQAVVQQEKQQK